MIEIDLSISPEEVRRLVARISATIPLGIGNERCREMLAVLQREWLESPTKTISMKGLAAEIGLPIDDVHIEESEKYVRGAATKLRTKILPRYYRDTPFENLILDFPPSKGGAGYRLHFRPKGTADSAPETKVPSPVILTYRQYQREWFQSTICKSKNVLIVSINAQPALDAVVQWFNRGMVTAKHFRILTWRPTSSEIVKAFVQHIDEDFDVFVRKQKAAWKSWKALENKFPAVEVYGYSTIPTMQAVCDVDSAIQIELLPFNRIVKESGYHASGIFDQRPLLLVNAKENPGTFKQFMGSFEDLWTVAMATATARDIHPRWRNSRSARLDAQGVTDGLTVPLTVPDDLSAEG